MGSELIKRVLRLRGKKISIKMAPMFWRTFDLLSENYGESADGFLERIVAISEFNHLKNFYVYPLFSKGEPIINELNELLRCSVKQNVSEALVNYGYLNNFYYDKKIKINSDSDLLAHWKKIDSGPIVPKISLNLRSPFFVKENDPLFNLIRISSEMDVTASSFLKSIYWDFCYISGLLPTEVIEMLESSDSRVEEKIKLKLLSKNHFEEFKLSPNIFAQFCLFRESQFSFKFLSRMKKEYDKKDLLIVNFLMKDAEGTLVHYTLPLLCRKFGRTQSEMFRLIIFVSLKRYNLLDDDFYMIKDFESRCKTFIACYMFSHGKVKTEITRISDDLIVTVLPWKRKNKN